MGAGPTRSFLFSDIEGSTKLWEDAPAAMSQALARHDELVRAAIEHAGGRVIKTAGDGFRAVFADPRPAIDAAVAIQRGVGAESWPPEAVIRVRIAVHAGRCDERDGDYFGPVMNRAARLEAIAHGGQIVVSSAAAAPLRAEMPAAPSLKDLGRHRLKDLQQPEHVFQVIAEGLPEDFAPLRSLGNPELLHNLPLQTTSLIGRDEELAEVRSLLAAARIVTLVGAGGVGKTRLALQTGADLLDGSGDGVWFVDLTPVQGDALVPAAVAAALGVRGEPGRPVADTLVDSMRDRRLLLILDNCEHVIDGSASLVSTLAERCAELVTLATSREPLRVAGERVYRVPSLALGGEAPGELVSSPAVQLFLQRGRAHALAGEMLEGDVSTVAAICRRLDGIPLAIELAAARLGALSVADLARRLDKRFELLTRGRRDVVPRHRTLRALIDWSYTLLSSGERDFLARLSVFPDTFDVDAAAALTDGPVSAVDLLSDLVDKSLVQAEPGGRSTRYRLLETIRTFSAERLAEQGEAEGDSARRAHRDHYLAFAEANEPRLWTRDLLEARARFEAEHANLTAALEYSLSDPDAGPGLRLVVALRRFWRLRGTSDEAARAASAQLGRPEAEGLGIARARALLVLASALSMSDPQSAIDPGRTALAIVGDSGEPRLQADLLVTLANATGQLGDIDGSRSMTAAALAIAREAADVRLIATCLNILIYYGTDDEATHAEAIGAADALGDPLTALAVRANIGNQALARGDLAVAKQHTKEALALAEELDFGRETVSIAGQLGWIEYQEGDISAARARFAAMARNAVRLGNRLLIAYGLLDCAVLAVDPSAAAQLHGAAERQFEEVGSAVEPFERERQLTSLRALRAELGDEAVDSLRSRGRGLAIAAALSLIPPATSPTDRMGDEADGVVAGVTAAADRAGDLRR